MSAALCAGIAGCAAAPPAELPAELPDGVTVEVLQGRTDYTSGTLVLRIINESDADLDVTGARLSWPGFAGPGVWERQTTVRAGITVDLRAPVPDVACDAGDRGSEPTADLSFVDGDRQATVTVPVRDPLSTLDRLRTSGCITEHVDRVATLSVGSLTVEGEGRGSVARLELTAVPTGAEGRVDISAVSATPLLQPDPSTNPTTEAWPLDLGIDAASGTVTTELRIVPARCDAHAIAEDKVGTVLNVSVRVADGESGDYPLLPPDGMREALLDYVRATCGLS